MLKKIKQLVGDFQQKRKQKYQLKQMQEYYKLVRVGGLFLQYIHKDLQRTKDKNMNRHQRRRFQKQLSQKGEFNKEIVDYYAKQAASIKKSIDNQLNPPKAGSVKINGKQI